MHNEPYLTMIFIGNASAKNVLCIILTSTHIYEMAEKSFTKMGPDRAASDHCG